jgi:transposase
VTRRLAHEPLGWRPATLLVTIRRYRCGGCGHVWRQDTSLAAEPRARLSRRGLRRALEGIVAGHLTVARVAEELGVAWNTASDAVLAEGKRVLIDDTVRFDNALVIGADEHVWRHTRHGGKYLTVITDLTTIRDGTGPARLPDMAEGRSRQVFKTWLAARTHAWRDGVEVVAMDGFSGFKTATTEELPDAVAVMDPFHVVYSARRTLHTGAGLLIDKQIHRLRALFAVEEHVEAEATWGTCQRMTAYRHEDRRRGRDLMTALTDSAPATGPRRRSTDASNTSAAQHSGSATSPTTSPEACSRPAGSDHDYTLNREEPVKPLAVDAFSLRLFRGQACAESLICTACLRYRPMSAFLTSSFSPW